MHPKELRYSCYRATQNIPAVIVLLAFVLLPGLGAADSDSEANEHFDTYVKVMREQASILNAGHQVKYDMRTIIPRASPWSESPRRPLLKATQTFVRGEGERSDREEVWEAGADDTIGALTTVAWNYNQCITIRHAEQKADINKYNRLGFDDFSPLHYPRFGGARWPDAFDIHVHESSRMVDGYLEITFANKYNPVTKYRYYVDTSNYTVVRQENISGEHIENAAVYSDYRMVEGTLMYPYKQVHYVFSFQAFRKDEEAVTKFDPDMAYQRFEVQVSEAAVTLDIPEDFFSPAPPDGYQVVNVLLNTSYIQGELPSADDLLDMELEALVENQGDNLTEDATETRTDAGPAAPLEESSLEEPSGVATDVEGAQPDEDNGGSAAMLVALAVALVLVLIVVGMTRRVRRK